MVLHTRRADREAAIGATSDALQGPGSWPDVHVLRGKEVVELAVTDVTKGRALRRLRADLGLEAGGVFFAGDDTTDERAFAVLDDDAGDVTVKVGKGPHGRPAPGGAAPATSPNCSPSSRGPAGHADARPAGGLPVSSPGCSP